MKNIKLLVWLLFFCVFVNPAQSQHWEWLNPKPIGNIPYRVRFTDPLTGFIVCQSGLILKTMDGGITWQ
jgi:photosystem II stability/assembly factor-like uncharacterized protein